MEKVYYGPLNYCHGLVFRPQISNLVESPSFLNTGALLVLDLVLLEVPDDTIMSSSGHIIVYVTSIIYLSHHWG